MRMWRAFQWAVGGSSVRERCRAPSNSSVSAMHSYRDTRQRRLEAGTSIEDGEGGCWTERSTAEESATDWAHARGLRPCSWANIGVPRMSSSKAPVLSYPAAGRRCPKDGGLPFGDPARLK